MPVTNQTPIVAYTANGVSVSFAFPFLLNKASDLIVLVSDVVKTLAVDYSISGAGLAAGGTVTFNSAPVSGARVVLLRRTVLERLTDYQTGGDNRANVLDADFDRLWLALQDGWLGVQQAISYQNGDIGPTRMPMLEDGQVLGRLGDELVGRNLSPDGDGVNFIQAGANAVVRTMQEKARERVSFFDMGAEGDGIKDDTAAVQATINFLGTSGGKIEGANGKTFKISSTLNFSGLGNNQAARVIDFGGAHIVWAGPPSMPIMKAYNNRFLTVKNFTLDGKSTPSVIGFLADSLQPLGTDHLVLDDFVIKNCDVGIYLGSTTNGTQNRVSDSRINNFLIENCNAGIYTASTNVDNVEGKCGIISACEKHIHFARAGFLAFRDVTGYGAKANGGINSFLYVSGPTGPLEFESCQVEDANMAPMYFFRRTDYTVAVDAPITFISCSADNDILFETGAGSGSIVNYIGGYFNSFNVLCSDLNVNLYGTRQRGGVLNIAGTNSFVRRFGSNLSAGTQTTAAAGMFEQMAGNGYSVLSNNLIFQWGTITPSNVAANSSRTDNVTFPKVFPNMVLSVSASALSDGTADVSVWSKTNATASGASIVHQNKAGIQQSIGSRWFAIGF